MISPDVGYPWKTNLNSVDKASEFGLVSLLYNLKKCFLVVYDFVALQLLWPNTYYRRVFVCFVLKSKGIQVDYLGANVPIADILYVANHHQSKLLYTHLTAPTKQFKIQKFLEQLKGIDSSIKVVLSGQYLSGIAKNTVFSY